MSMSSQLSPAYASWVTADGHPTTKAQLATAGDFLDRADRRIDGAAKAAVRSNTDPGEFDNNFDGVVTAIFHAIDAFELATTGVKRRVGEAE